LSRSILSFSAVPAILVNPDDYDLLGFGLLRRSTSTILGIV